MSFGSAADERPHITVVICTRNRAAQLELTLDSMTTMHIPGGMNWELLVIDNGSTDATSEVIAKFCDALPLRRIFHPLRGQGGARNAGLREARGEVIAWTDDDCIVDPCWLVALWAEFSADPQLAGLGGRVELYDPRDLPLTIQVYPKRMRLGIDGRFSRNELFMISGCNMAFRRRTFDSIGDFDLSLGPGSPGESADDTDVLYRALRRGLTILYTPTVLVYHNHGRRTGQQALRLKRSYGIGRGAFICKHFLKGDLYIARILAAEFVRSMHQLVIAVSNQLRWPSYIALGVWVRLRASLRTVVGS